MSTVEPAPGKVSMVRPASVQIQKWIRRGPWWPELEPLTWNPKALGHYRRRECRQSNRRRERSPWYDRHRYRSRSGFRGDLGGRSWSR
ncbi:hypothetical protein NDU88_003464 [Pleurodeles waltl]|uniref:Uncharacterized protein n=1 Tax=Pleurodeles waltl TaxID=8319 RepID=A0AAV7KYK1_PLEWA|nr:hypothetical protein NDU88_003464 [Pleurodeles waltl]